MTSFTLARCPQIVRRLLAGALASAVAGSMLLVSCADETIPLAKLPPLVEAGDALVGERCSDTDPCADNSYCERPSCDAPAGVCRAIQVCGGVDPVCGCDGVTYLNDCLRQLAGVSLRYDNSCLSDVAAPCHGSDDCRNAGRCVLFSDSNCKHVVYGACWAFGPLQSTSDCTPEPTFQHWDVCGPAGPEPCVDTCHAILSNQPIHPDMSCPAH